MRWILLSLLVACGPSAAPETPKPPAATCTTAAEHIIDELVAGKDPRPPDEAINAQIKIVKDHCDNDGWSEQARACFSRMKTLADADQCGTYLSAQQQSALGPPPPAE